MKAGSDGAPGHVSPIIGWGTDKATGKKYWIVRNSYGTSRGIGGEYIIERGKNLFELEHYVSGYEVELLS